MKIGTILKKYAHATTFNDVVLLLAHVSKKPKEFILAHSEYRISSSEIFHFWFLIFRLRRGWPLAYLTSHKEFFGLDFLVNKQTLIPRPETELLVDEAIKEIKVVSQKSKIVLIDVGTGTGCIPITIASAMKQCNNETIKIIASDISRGALKIAKKNAKKYNIPIIFLHGNLFEPIIQNREFRAWNSELIITANLPYLTREQFDAEPSIQKEPRSALVAAHCGLALYEELLTHINHSISFFPHFSIAVFLEIDPTQSEKIITLIKKYLPTASTEIKTDLAGRDRLVVLKINS